MAAYIEQAPVPDLLSYLDRVLALWRHPEESPFEDLVEIICSQLTNLIAVDKDSLECVQLLEDITQTIEKIRRSCLYFETVIATLWNRKKLGLKTEMKLVQTICDHFENLCSLKNIWNDRTKWSIQTSLRMISYLEIFSRSLLLLINLIHSWTKHRLHARKLSKIENKVIRLAKFFLSLAQVADAYPGPKFFNFFNLINYLNVSILKWK